MKDDLLPYYFFIVDIEKDTWDPPYHAKASSRQVSHGKGQYFLHLKKR